MWVYAIADQDGAVGFVEIRPAQADDFTLAHARGNRKAHNISDGDKAFVHSGLGGGQKGDQLARLQAAIALSRFAHQPQRAQLRFDLLAFSEIYAEI